MRFELRLLDTGPDDTATYAPRYCDGCGARMIERENRDVHPGRDDDRGDDFGWIATCNAYLICPNNCRTCGACYRMVPEGRQCSCGTTRTDEFDDGIPL